MAILKSRHGTTLDLAVADKALKEGNPQLAGEICGRVLSMNPNNVEAIILMAKILMDSEKSYIAVALAEKAVRLAENDWRAWLLLGHCESAQDGGPIDALNRANELSPNNPSIMRSLAFANVIRYNFEEAERWASKAIPLEDHPQGHVALGFAYLHQNKFGKGWDEYAYGMGHQPGRDRQDYGLPEWNGEKGRLLVYAEQGLGDQIAFCSSLADANVSQLVCHPKLHAMFAGSLDCEVHGDQFAKEIDWRVNADYQVSMSGLQRWTRRERGDFHGRSYLSCHPEKQFQWRALLRSISKRPKIGIAWTGGTVGFHGWKSRSLELSNLAPLFELNADFISLEYKPHEIGNYPVHVWPWGTQTDNYEDTTALVSCLDAVVCVPTTAYHLAGALGVPAYVLVHDTPHFHEVTPWWSSVTMIQRKGDYIAEVKQRLSNEDFYRSRPEAASSLQRIAMVD